MRGYKPRRRPFRREFDIILIICEGYTERIYFNRYKRRGSSLKIETPNTSKTDPVGLVNFAKKQIEKYGIDLENGDSIWVLFDFNSNTQVTIDKANRVASENHIILAPSNPSFELWFLLHFTYYENFLNNSELSDKLIEYIPTYNKTKCVFDTLFDGRPDAIKYSKKLNKLHERNGTELVSLNSNPSTQVFRVVEFILNKLGES